MRFIPIESPGFSVQPYCDISVGFYLIELEKGEFKN